MAIALNKPQNPQKPRQFNHFVGENYELALNQSIQNLLDSIRTPGSDLSAFTSAFYELMQARVYPPLETIWFYSALKFHGNVSSKDEPFDRFSFIKEIFQLISACSASLGSSKSIVLIAPVIYELHRLIVDLRAKELGVKRERKLKTEIKSLVDLILGYISVWCCKDSKEESLLGQDTEELIRPLGDLICVWVGDRVDETLEAEDILKSFFPLVSDDITGWLGKEKCGVCRLAGVVMAEAFLLRFCLDFLGGIERTELPKTLKTQVVSSITGFGNFYFFDTLLRMLLEPTLHVTSLLTSEDETLLRKVLYDAVILVEYSFVNPQRSAHLPAKHVRGLAMARLIVTNEAIELFREQGDQTKAISYTNAFSSSHLPSQLIKCVTSEIGMEGKVSQPDGSSPKAFLKWLLLLEDQGINLFESGTSKYRTRLVLDISEPAHQQPIYNDGKKLDADLLFYIDNKGEREDGNVEDQKTNETTSAAFVAAALTMKSAENDGVRKRKEGKNIGKKKRVKFLKYNIHDNSNSLGEKYTFSRDGSSSESEIENPLSDEDMEASKGL